MDYPRYRLEQPLVVDQIVTFHYSELAKDYDHPGERHDFWEFLYMDKGEAEIAAGGRVAHLKQGDLIFYTPNDFHSLRTNRRTAPNVLIVSFQCDSPAMDFFADRTFRLGARERSILTELLREGRLAFDPPVDRLQGAPLRRREPPVFGAEQLIKLHLERLLIELIRGGGSPAREPLATGAREKAEADAAERIVRYLEERLADNPTPRQIARHFNLGQTKLKTLFKAHTGHTLTEYAHLLKIERAKRLIREERLTFTEIAERLGYSSIHYFSRHFKRVADMTPSEYDKSLKARAIDPAKELSEWTAGS